MVSSEEVAKSWTQQIAEGMAEHEAWENGLWAKVLAERPEEASRDEFHRSPKTLEEYRALAEDESSDYEAGWYRQWMLELLDLLVVAERVVAAAKDPFPSHEPWTSLVEAVDAYDKERFSG